MASNDTQTSEGEAASNDDSSVPERVDADSWPISRVDALIATLDSNADATIRDRSPEHFTANQRDQRVASRDGAEDARRSANGFRASIRSAISIVNPRKVGSQASNRKGSFSLSKKLRMGSLSSTSRGSLSSSRSSLSLTYSRSTGRTSSQSAVNPMFEESESIGATDSSVLPAQELAAHIANDGLTLEPDQESSLVQETNYLSPNVQTVETTLLSVTDISTDADALDVNEEDSAVSLDDTNDDIYNEESKTDDAEIDRTLALKARWELSVALNDDSAAVVSDCMNAMNDCSFSFDQISAYRYSRTVATSVFAVDSYFERLSICCTLSELVFQTTARFGLLNCITMLLDECFFTKSDYSLALKLACVNGHQKVVEKLAAHPAVDSSSNCFNGFRKSCKYGHVDLVEYWLKNHPIDTSGGHLGLCAASKSGHVEVVRILLLETTCVQASHSGNEAIKAACDKGQLDVVRLLLKDDNVVREPYVKLAMSCRVGDLETVSAFC
jgi:hypothetical protein